MCNFNQEYFDLRFDTIDKDNGKMLEHLSKLNGRVGKVEIEQAETRGSIATWKWIAGSGGLIGIITFALVMLR